MTRGDVTEVPTPLRATLWWGLGLVLIAASSAVMKAWGEPATEWNGFLKWGAVIWLAHLGFMCVEQAPIPISRFPYRFRLPWVRK